MDEEYRRVYLPEKNITLRFPKDTSDEEIREIVKRDWDKLPDRRIDLGTWIGRKLAGGYETAVSPEWSLKETAKKALGGAVEAVAYGTPVGRAVTFGVPFLSQAISGLAGLASIPVGMISAVRRGEKDVLGAGLETATRTIEKVREPISKVPVIGKPVSPVGETVQKAFTLVPETVEKGIAVAQEALGVEKEPTAEPLREIATEIASYSLYGILGSGKVSPTIRDAVVKKYFPNKKSVLDLPPEVYKQKYTDFRDFITKNDLDISTRESREFAVKAYNDVLTVQRAMAKEVMKQAKKVMTDSEIRQVIEARRKGMMTLDDWRNFKEFKRQEYIYNAFEEAIRRSDLTKEEIEEIRQELLRQMNYRPPEKGPKVVETPEERQARLEMERLEEIREELIRQADEEAKRIKDEKVRQERKVELDEQLKRIDRLIEERYRRVGLREEPTTGKSIKYRFIPTTRAGEFYDHLIRSGFSEERAEQIVNTVYPEAPKIEVVTGYRVRERVTTPKVEKPVEGKPTEVEPEKITEQPEIKSILNKIAELKEVQAYIKDTEGSIPTEKMRVLRNELSEKLPKDFPLSAYSNRELWELARGNKAVVDDFNATYNRVVHKETKEVEPETPPASEEPIPTKTKLEGIPPELEPSAREARKYKSAPEIVLESEPEFSESSIVAKTDKELIQKLLKYIEKTKEKEKLEPLTISIQNATYTITEPTKENLTELVKAFRGATRKPPETRRKTPSIEQKLMSRKDLESEGISYCNPYKIRTPSVSLLSAEDVSITNDNFVVIDRKIGLKLSSALEEELKKRKKSGREVGKIDNAISNLLSPNPEKAFILAEAKLMDDKQSCVLVSDLKTPPKEFWYNPHNIDYILKMYPKAEVFLHENGLLEFRQEGQTVGATMPYRNENIPDLKSAFRSRIEELKQMQVLKEPENRSEYVDSLSKTSPPTIEEIQKAEAKMKGKKSKLRKIEEILRDERGELVLGYRSVESVLQELGVVFKKLPEPLEYFKGIKGEIRKKIMLNSTIANLFPHVKEHMDTLDLIERLPNKFKFEEFKLLEPFFTLENPEKVYRFIEKLRIEGKRRSTYPLTDEVLTKEGFTEAEKRAILSFADATHRYMDFYVRRILLNHARLDGDYEKPFYLEEAEELIRLMEERNEKPHIIKQAEAIRDIHRKVDDLADQYYFPASRFGKYYILAKTPDGKTAYLAHVDKKHMIPEVVKTLKEEHPEWKIEVGENYKPRMELAYELPPHILSILKSAIEDLEKSGALNIVGKDLLVELEHLSAKWKAGFATHLLEAELIPGWEKNLKKSVADYVHKMTKNYVYSEYIPEFRKLMAQLDPYKDAPLIEILNKNLKDIMSSNNKFRWLGRFMFLYYLGGNFKSAVINATQPVAITFPWAMKYVPVKEASKMFTKAYQDAINYRLKRYNKIDIELRTMMDEFVKTELLIAQGIKEMSGYRESVRGLKTIPQSVFEFLSIPFREAEIMNRYHAVSMFFQIGKKKKLSGKSLMDFVREGLNATQFDYTTMGLPQIARGALRPMFIFRVYAINWLSRARQLLREREYKSFATLLGTHLILGGMTGVPFAMELLKAIHWAYNKLADRENAFEEDIRALGKEMSEEYGENLVDYMLYGLPGLAGVTIGASLNPVEIGTLDTQHPVYELIKTITGVTPDIAIRAERAYNIWKKHSDTYRAVEAMMPEFIRNALVAYRWYAEQGASMPSGEIIFTPNLFQMVIKSLGFSPVEYIKMLSRREVISNILEEHKRRSANIHERLGLALARGDMKTFTEIINAVVTQNIKNIEQGKPPIIINENAVKLHMLKILSPEAYRLRRTPKVLRPEIREIEELYGGGRREEEEE